MSHEASALFMPGQHVTDRASREPSVQLKRMDTRDAENDLDPVVFKQTHERPAARYLLSHWYGAPLRSKERSGAKPRLVVTSSRPGDFLLAPADKCIEFFRDGRVERRLLIVGEEPLP